MRFGQCPQDTPSRYVYLWVSAFRCLVGAGSDQAKSTFLKSNVVSSFDPKLFDAVCSTAREAMMLQSTADALEWDERTGMPIAAGDYRAQQVSTLRAMVHRLKTGSVYGENLQQLNSELDGKDPGDDQVATVRELHRDWDRDRRLPTELVQKTAEATVRGQQSWDAARKADDFGMFRDTLKAIVELKREAGQRLSEGTDSTAYEALVDEYEPNARVADLKKSFDELRVPLVELIAQTKEAPNQPRTEILRRNYDIDRQRKFSQMAAERVGFDFDRGRIDETSHPFCTTLGPDDCRILTRYESNWLPSGLFGTLHEAGHGMYEQGLRRDWFGLPPGSYVSLGMHESQSRLWENQVGRSRPFWKWMFPEARKIFAPQLDDVSLDEFYFSVNAVQPSLIRVEADEATYNLHIIIRFDLERDLIGGELEVNDLPTVWNDRYESDLGVRPSSDADGVLQDVHWSAGLFGYFPTYTLGNLAGAQLFDAAVAELGQVDMLCEAECQKLLEWLRNRVHRQGRCLSGAELVKQATGRELSADSLIQYLGGKLRGLYGITA